MVDDDGDDDAPCHAHVLTCTSTQTMTYGVILHTRSYTHVHKLYVFIDVKVCNVPHTLEHTHKRMRENTIYADLFAHSRWSANAHCQSGFPRSAQHARRGVRSDYTFNPRLRDERNMCPHIYVTCGNLQHDDRRPDRQQSA